MLLSKATYSAFRLYIFCQYACSLGIEPITFALLMQCSNHWATGTKEFLLVKLLYISYFLCYHKYTKIQNNYKITSMKKYSWWTSCCSCWSGQSFSLLLHHIWCFPLPCTREKNISLRSPAIISYDVLTCSIHGIQQRHLINDKWLNGWFKLYWY